MDPNTEPNEQGDKQRTAARTAKALASRATSVTALKVVAVAGTVFALIVLAIAVIAVFISSVQSSPSDLAIDDIPPAALAAYQQANGTCTGLTWNLLAGIGKVESNHGRVFGGAINPDTGDVEPPIFGAALNGSGAGGNITPWPAGQWENQWGLTGPWLRALGPMQFISPTWATFQVDANNDGNLDPHNMFDAVQGAANLLCDAAGGQIDDPREALFAYNRSEEYGNLVLTWAQNYVILAPVLGGGTADDLVNHPNIELSSQARSDLEQGIIDPRLIATVVSVADNGYTLYIGWLKTGHSECVGGGSISERPNCNVSNHFYGRAVDIGAVGRQGQSRDPVTPENQVAQQLVNELGALATTDPLRPESLGSPWDDDVHEGHFTDGNHHNHLHIAWHTEPPADFSATQAGLENPPQLDRITVPATGAFAAPIELPARPTQQVANPSTINSVIANAQPGTQIVLEAGNYAPIRITNKSGISLIGPTTGTATIELGSFTSGFGVTVDNSNDIVVSGIHVTETLWGIVVQSSTDVTVANNHVHHTGQEAIHIKDNSSHIVVANNLVHHTGQRPGIQAEQGLPYRTFGEGIYLGTGREPGDTTNNVLIIGNHIHHTSSEAIDIKNGVHTVRIVNNIIHDISTQTSAAVVTHLGTGATNGPPVEIIGNVIWNITRTSQWTDGNAFKLSSPANMRGNIIWNSQHRGITIENANGLINIERNVIFDNDSGDIVLNGHSPANVSSNLGREIFELPEFNGGWVQDNQPTPALIRLITALSDPTIPIDDVQSQINPPPITATPVVLGSTSNGSYTIDQVIHGTIGAGDGSNPNEEAPMGRHEAPLYLPQGWNWSQGPTRNTQWGQLGTGGSQFAEWRCAVIPEFGHTPPVPFRINIRNGAYYQYANGNWNKAFDANLIGGNKGGYLGTAGQLNNDPFSAHSHGLIPWRQEPDGSFSAPWNQAALFMHFWAGRRQAPAPGQTAEFLTSEMRIQQPDSQTVDLSQVRVLFQCGIDYYNTTGGQGTKVPGPGIATYTRLTTDWRPGLWITLPPGTPANNSNDFRTWLQNNPPPNVTTN